MENVSRPVFPVSSNRFRHLVEIHGWRAFWVVVLFVHALALRGIAQSLTGADPVDFSSVLVRGLGLLLGVAFCGLKLLDVACLRLKPGWRSTVAASVAMALLHVGVIEHNHAANSALAPTPVGVVLFIGTFVDVDALRTLVRKRLASFFTHLRRVGANVHLNPYLRPFEAAFDPVRPAFSLSRAAQRAPPFSS